MRHLAIALLTSITLTSCRAAPFSDDERARIVDYWNAPGRCAVGLPPAEPGQGPWRAGLTPDGSAWFLRYQRAVGAAKLPPTQDAAGTSPDAAAWERWVQARVALDWARARQAADAANGRSAGARTADAPQRQAPGAPGPIPPGLLAAAGNPPALAAAVAPMQHTVKFDDGEVYVYVDNRLFDQRPRFAYYRHADGTVFFGPTLKDMPPAELDALFSAAGFAPSEQRAARAVSALEGGFESVNTYDTGSVSVGFIQFVTMEDGRHSLLEVLAQHKADDPADFEGAFRRFGLDVSPEGVLVAVDPDSGAELAGPDAVRKVIADKRLTAVFQRAGRHSRPFRVAQVKVAKAHYWPADDPVTVTVEGRTFTGKVSDVVKSEAGMATLFDRKVNRGSISPFPEVLGKVMTDRHLASLADAAAYEREIVAACKYRTDFLARTDLSQPK